MTVLAGLVTVPEAGKPANFGNAVFWLASKREISSVGREDTSMQNSLLQFDELDSFGAGNVSPRTMKALQNCDVLDKVGVHVVSIFHFSPDVPILYMTLVSLRQNHIFCTAACDCR